MKMKKTLLVAGLLSLCTAGMAQATYTDSEGNEYEFKKHAFLDLQGGAQYTLGEAKFDKLLSPNVQLGLGYQFSPVFGMRLQANGWQSKAGWNGFRAKVGDAPYTNDYKWNYVAPGLDLMFNLSNLFCGWNPNRVFNVIAFVGGGANIAWKNDEAQAIASNLKSLNDYDMGNLWDGTQVLPYGRGGVELNFRVSKAVSIMVEGNANILSDKYNSKDADNPDWYFNGLVGLRINLGKSYTKKAKVVEEPAPAPAPAPVPVKKEEPKPVEKKVEDIRRDVFFVINSSNVRPAEEQKVQEVVEFLNSHPDAKVAVTGYADRGTGNDKINDRIAAKRADAVAKLLVEKYGIDASRVTSDSKGSREQPFSENDSNRVSIMLAK